MQQLFDFSTTWYFAFGCQGKTSLCSQFCRENEFLHFVNPSIDEFQKPIQKNAIIEGSVDLFTEVEKMKPQVSVIFVGEQINGEREAQICKEYEQIGRCFRVKCPQYEQFRKTLYPNLIFFYGPVEEQNRAASFTLAKTINYEHSVLPQNANALITFSKKSENYVVNGLFTDCNEIKILEQYFHIRVVHFKYNRLDLPGHDEFFAKEYDLLPFLKDKPYYIPVCGSIDPVTIMDKVGIGLCPRLIYINQDSEQQCDYVNEYICKTEGLLLDTDKIFQILKRKNYNIFDSWENRVRFLTEIFYKDLDRKEIALTCFPKETNQFVHLENLNRKIQKFVDLTNCEKYQYADNYSSGIYFLEGQKRVTPNLNIPLACQLSDSVEYWVVGGPSGAGKSTVAEYVSKQFGFKLFDFEKDFPAVKEKLANPDEGEEVPVKKILNHFKCLLQNNKDCTYIFDCIPYDNNDLAAWIQTVGTPNVLNLEVCEKEQVIRARKKAGGDGAGDPNEEEAAKAKENTQKASKWMEKLMECAPTCRVETLNYDKAQVLAEADINCIMQPKIFLVQRNNHTAFQNIAIKYNVGYVNLGTCKLRDCAKAVKCCKSKNVILNQYAETDERLVSDDLYWIEKNLGEIRYLAISTPESKVAVEEKLVLEKPVVQEKPKPVDEQGQEKPPEDPPEGEQKKSFNVHDYEWTNPTTHKNLSQWFLKLKSNVTQCSSSPAECFNNFGKALECIKTSNANFYEIVQ